MVVLVLGYALSSLGLLRLTNGFLNKFHLETLMGLSNKTKKPGVEFKNWNQCSFDSATKTRETTTSGRNSTFCSDLTRLFGCWNIRWELCSCLRRPSWRRKNQKYQKLWPQQFQNLNTFKLRKKVINFFEIFRLSFILR